MSDDRKLPPSPLERAKARYRPMRSVDEIVGLERERARRDCACYRCTLEAVTTSPRSDGFGGSDLRMSRMFLCAICGNKRCPHAADHRLACTGSNAPGQPGSLYEHAPIPPAAERPSHA